jgi:hypothetical protein
LEVQNVMRAAPFATVRRSTRAEYALRIFGRSADQRYFLESSRRDRRNFGPVCDAVGCDAAPPAVRGVGSVGLELKLEDVAGEFVEVLIGDRRVQVVLEERGYAAAQYRGRCAVHVVRIARWQRGPGQRDP